MPKCEVMEPEVQPDLFARLLCPKCRRPVVRDRSLLVCTNTECGLRYRVVDGIPVMLVEEAERHKPVAGKAPPA
jgi:uncharacterized protein YbaR (Trm112 family)